MSHLINYLYSGLFQCPSKIPHVIFGVTCQSKTKLSALIWVTSVYISNLSVFCGVTEHQCLIKCFYLGLHKCPFYLGLNICPSNWSAFIWSYISVPVSLLLRVLYLGYIRVYLKVNHFLFTSVPRSVLCCSSVWFSLVYSSFNYIRVINLWVFFWGGGWG